jgi:CBS domain-containing protein
MRADSVRTFEQTVETFLRHYSPRSLDTVCVRPDSTLDEAIGVLMTREVHHAFVVNQAEQPVGANVDVIPA